MVGLNLPYIHKMKQEEFKLSDKGHNIPLGDDYFYLGKDIKEFIRLLKERILFLNIYNQSSGSNVWLLQEIDKLSGGLK